MVAFPVVKLGSLFVKQISSPIARRLVNGAKRSSLFRNWVCVPLGQLYHFYEVQLKLAALNIVTRKVTKVPKLSEEDAIELGSAILSEILILAVAVGIIVYEYTGSVLEKKEEEQLKKEERQMLKDKLYQLEFQLDKNNESINSIAKTFIKRCSKEHSKNMMDIIDENASSKKERIEHMKFLDEEQESEETTSTESKSKSMTEDFVEFMEEVVEEVLDAVNPDDDE